MVCKDDWNLCYCICHIQAGDSEHNACLENIKELDSLADSLKALGAQLKKGGGVRSSTGTLVQRIQDQTDHGRNISHVCPVSLSLSSSLPPSLPLPTSSPSSLSIYFSVYASLHLPSHLPPPYISPYPHSSSIHACMHACIHAYIHTYIHR